MQAPSHIPSLPQIGHAESYYARHIHRADKSGDIHLREALKVAQYITLGNDPHLRWEQKRRYFEHAFRRHCVAPPIVPDAIWLFYAQLKDLVREHAGLEALRLASREDDRYAERRRLGEPPGAICEEARGFFRQLMGGDERHKPDYFTDEDWHQLQVLRAQWT